MGKDITLPIENGVVNLRVAAIIMKDGKVLMNKSSKTDFLFTIGGRIQFGESSEEAVVREVMEETGVRMEIDHLGFVHENIFIADANTKGVKPVYEIEFYYFMKTPQDFTPAWEIFEDGGNTDKLVWLDPKAKEKYYPEFFRTELLDVANREVKYIFTDERK